MDQANKFYPLVPWMQALHQKSGVVGSPIIPAQVDQKVLSLFHQKGEVNFRHFPKPIRVCLWWVTGNIPYSSKFKTDKKILIEDV